MTRPLPRCPRPGAGVLTAALAMLLGGCAASGSPALDSRFGEASRLMRQQQAIDPDAARRADVRVPASDGRTVRHAMDRLAESYRQPGASSVVGDGASAGGASLPTR
jgi:hypothetical protein